MAGGSAQDGRTVFVTVGTTKFDALIRAVDDPDLADVLVAKGYSRLVMQVGAGVYLPQNLLPHGVVSGRLANGLEVTYFDFALSLGEHMGRADLIVSHAGSGSLFEGLRMGKVMVAVPNAGLMDNHQAELADHMSAMGVLVSATPETLLAAIEGLNPHAVVPFESGNPQDLATAIDVLMGF